MTHPYVLQLRFARSEFMRGLAGVSAQDALVRVGPMNCMSWIVGHLANQENAYWVRLGQGQRLYPELSGLVGYGSKPSTPPLEDMLSTWRAVTAAADKYLDSLTPERLKTYFELEGKPVKESVGTMLFRNLYHYWYHTGESQAIRQTLGHVNLPEYVGEMPEIG
jgi:uncharacterized damage-inducible protein DinB